VVPKAQIEEATLELAKKIVSYSPSVIGLGKKAFYQQMAQPDISQVPQPQPQPRSHLLRPPNERACRACHVTVLCVCRACRVVRGCCVR
jgi:hypothetical protein